MRAAPHRGHERRLKSGAWEVQVSLAGQRRTVRGDTLTEARARLAELVADHQRGLTGRDARRERVPLAVWLRAWLEGKRGTVVPSTWAMHRVCVVDRASVDFTTRRVVGTLRALAGGAGEADFVLSVRTGSPHSLAAVRLRAEREPELFRDLKESI